MFKKKQDKSDLIHQTPTFEIRQILALVLEKLRVVFSRGQISQFLERLSVRLAQLYLVLEIRYQLVVDFLYIP